MTITKFPKIKLLTIIIPMNYEKIFKDDSIIKEHELY